jgi:PKD repeat protein
VENEYHQYDTETKTSYISVSDLFLLVDFVGVPRQGASPLIVDFTNQTILPPGHTSVIWVWDFGDGYTSTDRDPTHMYLSGGWFTVTLKAFVQL